ncbi:MAG: 4Fe-4S dicluster domain-containing protein [Actinobacteria bacterium]|nr:4Fe-4S dicluster domain-containing protein [Actinomycetota bacterium]
MKFLAQDQLQAFLGHLAGESRVVAPVKGDDGVVLFRPWSPGTEVELDVLLAKQSAKEFVLRQSETYLRYGYAMEGEAAAQVDDSHEAKVALEDPAERKAAQDAAVTAHAVLVVEPVNDAPAQVIFGLRPCDARGFVQMDNVFGGYGGFYFDPYYNAKREATTLVAVTCRDPRSTCFCTSVQGGPAATEGADVLLTQVEGGFAVEVVTERGETLLASADLADAGQAQVLYAETVKETAEARVDAAFDLEGVREHLRANIEDSGWHDLSMRCISCGTCTYVCPNCYCFNITDEMVEGQGERIRTWDNCFNPSYTLETSGHNPRDIKSNRFRNRFSHKFWYYPEKYDSLLCSGCGRCITHCPTRIDIREVLGVMGSERTAVSATTPATSGGEA